MILSIGSARSVRGALDEEKSRPGRDGAGHTVIHADLVVRGELRTDGHVEIIGRVEGTINSHSILVREGGEVEGTLLAEFVEVRGTVVGPVRANNVTIGRDAVVVGSVFHNTLTIEPGARLEGRRPWRPHIDRNAEPA